MKGKVKCSNFQTKGKVKNGLFGLKYKDRFALRIYSGMLFRYDYHLHQDSQLFPGGHCVFFRNSTESVENNLF